MKKFLKFVLLVNITLIFGFSLTVALFFILPTNSELDIKSLENTGSFTTFYDLNDKEISTYSLSADKLAIKSVPKTVEQAFIASEDKNFYSHGGVDYLRIIKAAFVDITSGRFSQGASTISQQLIKNTQLTNEKTIGRKLREIKLTQKLESVYSKNKILEMYLNTIYFGENCYGIQSAAEYYFGKSAEELSLNEATLLAATIKSPSSVNPKKDLNALKQKQKNVLKSMERCGFITSEDIEKTESETILVQSNDNNLNSPYFSAVYSEIQNDVKLNDYQLKNCKIYTGYDEEVQQNLSYERLPYDRQSIVIDNKTLEINGYYSTCGEILRAPASTIKPLAVYAPAIEKGLITQYSIIDDTKTSFGDYSPDNYKSKYYGNVYVRDALKLSLNIPSVKVLNMIGTEMAISSLNKMGFMEANKNLNLALGVTDSGVSLKTIAGAYSTFANFGVYKKPHFIRKILDENGKTVYEYKPIGERVFSDGTASVITDILKECSLSGTAKLLKDLSFEVASKTGTYGNEKGNTDAYSISYTTDKTIASWVGNADSSLMPDDVTGGGLATRINLSVLNNIYKNKTPSDFVYKDVKYLYFDKYMNETQGRLLLADKNTPEKYAVKGLFTNNDYPKELSTAFVSPTVKEEKISLKDNKVKITYNKSDFYSVKIYRKDDKGKKLVYEGNKSAFEEVIPEGKFEYSIIPVVKGRFKSYCGKELFLPMIENKISLKSITPLPDEWWNDKVQP